MQVYLDYSAGMPTRKEVIEEMQPYFTEKFGNPSSLHSFGVESKKAIENARKKVASLINARKEQEIIFTSSATESNNLALKGIAFRNRDRGNHIITSAIEHRSILNTCRYLEKNGFRITYLPVDKFAIVDVENLKEEVSKETILVSIQYANGEVGTVQNIKEIGEFLKDKETYFHVDGTASIGKIPCNVEKEFIDLLTISSNDIYGPKGVASLYIKDGTKIEPIIHGGGQEGGIRSGTENVSGIVGFGKASELAKAEMEEESKRLKKLRDKLINGILQTIKYSFLNGHPIQRLPNNANLRFSFIEGEGMILNLDMLGIYTSTSSACTSKTLEPSHVLIAMGISHEESQSALLLTLGKDTKEEEIDYVLEVLPDIVKRLRAMSPLTPKEIL